MRRKDREISGLGEMESIIQRADICRLAFCDRGIPYVVPLCFGYRRGAIYFHSAREGRKLDMMRNNRLVCFEMDIDQEPFIYSQETLESTVIIKVDIKELTGKACGY
jgi:nitroimidazol reductase NimA-like FMN-containing flavoprotein (pyridoxamine 5'-phosphate oxidase superfamily)